MNSENNITSNLHELQEATERRIQPKRNPAEVRPSGEDDKPHNLRVKFQKRGKLQFISHLDLARTMRTAITRAGVPVKFSEGFNPHPKMSFALQLSVGCESTCEFMELKLTREPDCSAIKEALNKNLPQELCVEDVYVPVRKPTELCFAEYEIVYYPDEDENVPDFSTLITNPLIVLKKTKSGERETDIRPQIKRFSQNGSTVKVVLCSDNTSYLNPEYIAKLAHIRDYDIVRIKTFLSDGVTEFR